MQFESSRIDISKESLTANLARKFSKILKRGDVVFLYGEIGVGKTYILSLRDSRGGAVQDSASAPGNEIGVARVYDFKLESGSYSTDNANTNEWGLSLFDVQPFTFITLNLSLIHI